MKISEANELKRSNYNGLPKNILKIKDAVDKGIKILK